MVYEKSALGHNEFISNKRTLSVRERQVLLLVNGIRNLDELEKFFKKELLIDTIKKLESAGYIQRPNAKPTSPSTSQTTPSFFDTQNSILPICPTKLMSIKTILGEASDDYLGIMGRSIKLRIEACANETDLKHCISSWHMAMRESKLGRESASFLMEQIHQILENKMMDASLNHFH